MKINKIVFSCSEQFSPFWNIQSYIWAKKYNIHPVCLLYGNIKNTNMSQEYGTVIEKPFDEKLPPILQITTSKFFHPTTEPDTTWMVGDIDMLPLSSTYFTQNLEQISDDSYVHLNFNGCQQHTPVEMFFACGSRRTGGFDLPAHYHISKGKYFKQCFFTKSFEETVFFMANSPIYVGGGYDKSIHGTHWCIEESYTSECIWKNIKNNSIDFKYGLYNNIENRIDRYYHWECHNGKEYNYNIDKLKNNKYVDIHCYRPYEKQEKSMLEILKLGNII